MAGTSLIYVSCAKGQKRNLLTLSLVILSPFKRMDEGLKKHRGAVDEFSSDCFINCASGSYGKLADSQM